MPHPDRSVPPAASHAAPAVDRDLVHSSDAASPLSPANDSPANDSPTCDPPAPDPPGAHDLTSHIPPTARRVLCLGFSPAEMKLAERGVSVTVIEPAPDAAALARERGLTAVDSPQSLTGQHFDALILGDLLDHGLDPAGLLLRYAGFLSTGAPAIFRIPNARRTKVFWDLFVRGALTYRSGILDPTPVPLATVKMAARWCHVAGLSVGGLDYQLNTPFQRGLARGSLGLLSSWLAPHIVIIAGKDKPPRPWWWPRGFEEI